MGGTSECCLLVRDREANSTPIRARTSVRFGEKEKAANKGNVF